MENAQRQLTEAEFFNSLTELTLWEKRLERLCLIEQSLGKTNVVLVIGQRGLS